MKTNQQILDDAPEGATHLDDECCEYFKKDSNNPEKEFAWNNDKWVVKVQHEHLQRYQSLFGRSEQL